MNNTYVDEQYNDNCTKSQVNETKRDTKDTIVTDNSDQSIVSASPLKDEIHNDNNLITISISKSFVLKTLKVIAIIAASCFIVKKLKGWHDIKCTRSFNEGYKRCFNGGYCVNCYYENDVL